MAALMLDTHVVMWLYAGRLEKLPEAAKLRLERDDLVLSPMVALELQYLHEIGRLTVGAEPVLNELAKAIGLRISDTAFDRVSRVALKLSWARDPFDRLIAAQSLVEEFPLLTADAIIRKHLPLALWD